jgi:aspartate-semialdehyde dehydrogenase
VQPLNKKVYPYQIAFNVIPQVDSFGPNGYTGEETKMMQESRKIMGLPESQGVMRPACACRWCARIRSRSTPSLSVR